jgi:hypothetical protein
MLLLATRFRQELGYASVKGWPIMERRRADFLLGPKHESGEDTCVLCEINVRSVSPFSDSAVTLVAQATLARTDARGETQITARTAGSSQRNRRMK